MATVIDALLVTLGLDNSEFKKGEQEAEKMYNEMVKKAAASAKAIVDAAKGKSKEEIDVAKATAKELMTTEKKAAKAISDSMKKEAKETTEKIKEQTEKGKEFFKGMAESAMEFFGIMMAAGAMVEFVKGTLEAEVSAGRLSKTLNMDVEDLEAFQGAVKRVGGTAEGMDSSLKGLNSRLEMIAIHGPRSAMALKVFAGLGISEVALKGKDATQVMGLLAEKMEHMSGAKAMALGERLGLDEGTVRLLQKGKEGMEALTSAVKKHVASAEQVEAAEKFEQSMLDIKGALAATGRDLMSNLMPALQFMAQTLGKVAQWARDHSEVIKAGILGIAAAFLAVNGAAILMGINAAIAWFMATWPLVLLVAGIAAVAAGLYLLIKHIREVGHFFNEVALEIVFQMLKAFFTVEHAGAKMWKALLAGAKAALGWIGDKLKSIGNVVLKVATLGMAGGSTPQPASAGAGANASMAMRPSVANSSHSTSTSTRETHIGQITVQTQATDAKGIAKDIGGAVKSHGLVDQADGGM